MKKQPRTPILVVWTFQALFVGIALFWITSLPSCVVGEHCPSPQRSCKTATDCPASLPCQNGCCSLTEAETATETAQDASPSETNAEIISEIVAETLQESPSEPTKPPPCRADAECPKEFPDCRAGECIKLCQTSEVCLPTYRCFAGYCQICPDGTSRNATEQCNNQDDNCDGLIDEGLSQPCYTGSFGCKQENGKYTCLGGCQSGTQICKNGQWQTCVGEILPQPETCDGKDNDCDGLIDDTHNCVSTLATSVQLKDFTADTKGQIFATIGAQIQRYTPQKNAFETFSGSTVGTQDGPPLQAQFTDPRSITIDPQGNLYVIDTNKLRKIDPIGNVSTITLPTEIILASGVQVIHHPSGFLYFFSSGFFAYNLATKQAKKIHNPSGGYTFVGWSLDPITQALHISQNRGSDNYPDLVLSSPLDKAFTTEYTRYTVPFAIDHEGRVLEGIGPQANNLPSWLQLRPGNVPLSNKSTPCRTATTKCNQDGPLAQALFGSIKQIVALPDGSFLLYDSDNQSLRKVTRPAPDACAQVNSTRSCYTGPPNTAKIGTCKDGEQTCTHDGWGVCHAQQRPSPEICNNLDDNCNGQIDEEIPSTPPCAKQHGACQYSIQSCKNGVWTACQDADYFAQNSKYATSEICDAHDNDCNGLIDEGLSDCIHTLPIQRSSTSTSLQSIITDPQGNFYFIEGHAIQKHDAAGQTTTLAGWSYGFADGAATQARFYNPTALALAGNLLYVADQSNHRIRRIDLTTRQVSTLAGVGSAGLQDGTAAQAQFSNPTTLALGTNNDLYVGENNNLTIRRITLSSPPVVDTLLHNSTSSTTSLGSSRQFDFLPSRDLLYIASSHGLHTFNVNTRSFNNIFTSRSDIIAVAARSNGDLFYATRSQVFHLNSTFQELQKSLARGTRGGIPGNFANASFGTVIFLRWTPQGHLLINDGGYAFDRWQP